MVLGMSHQLSLPEGGQISLKIPECSQTGQKLKVKRKGLWKSKAERGDLFVELKAALPRKLTQEEKKIWEQLKASSTEKARR
jgi:curved DNA-binding protein